MSNVGFNIVQAFNTLFKKQQPKVHYFTGEILEMAQKKSGKGVISFASHNGRMLQEHARREQILNEVFALRPTHNYNLVTQPKTQNFGQVIDEMYGARMKAADDYLRAESLGKPLPKAIEDRRDAQFELFTQEFYEYKTFKGILQEAEVGFKEVDVTRALQALNVTPKGREYDEVRLDLLKMVDKAVKEGKDVFAYKKHCDITELDDAILSRIKVKDKAFGLDL